MSEIPSAAIPAPRESAEQRPAAAAAQAKPARGGHRYDIDLLRFICACAVIMGHVGGELMAEVGKRPENGRAAYWTGIFLDSATSWAVPTYFAVAGWAVLVGAPPRNGTTLRTRSLRMIIPVGIWTVAYIAWGRYRDTNGEPSSRLALDGLFGTIQPAYHLWYFYAHVPLILVLGFVMLLKAGQRSYGVAAALLVVAAGPTALGDVGQLTDWDVPKWGWQFGTYSIVYAVTGALLFSLPATKTRHRPLWAAGAVVSLGAVIWSQHRIHFVIPNASLFVAALTACLLMALNGVRIPDRMRPRLSRLTAAGLGAFMCHVLLLKTISPHLVDAGQGWLTAPAAALLLFLATAVPAFAASMLWGRLGLRRYLG